MPAVPTTTAMEKIHKKSLQRFESWTLLLFADNDDKAGVENDGVGEGDALDSCNNENNDDFERKIWTNL